MKKFILLLAVLFLLPSACFAEVYQNRDYNFQLEIPDGWVDNEIVIKNAILNKETEYIFDQKKYRGVISLKIWRSTEFSDKLNMESMSQKEKEIFQEWSIKGIQENHPDFKATYTNVIKIGNNTVALIKGEKTNIPLKLSFALIVNSGNEFAFTYVTNDPERTREPEFIEMIKSLKPIY